jgi:hypothetical protein
MDSSWVATTAEALMHRRRGWVRAPWRFIDTIAYVIHTEADDTIARHPDVARSGKVGE